MGKWDRGIDYESMYRKLVKLIQHAKPPAKCYYITYLVQLRNGSRVGESLEAFRKFIKERKREVLVRVEKRKDNVERLMVLPEDLTVQDIAVCKEWVDNVSVNSVKAYCKLVLNVNTHSFRYAYITYLLKQNVSPSIIAKITKHKTLNYILEYTQEKQALEVLRNGL